MSAFHLDPAREWSVASLANEVAMSRSAFAARLTELAGQPAMAYVTWRRMQAALGFPRDEGPTAADASDRVRIGSGRQPGVRADDWISPGPVRSRVDELVIPA
jgi:hypothetical protein